MISVKSQGLPPLPEHARVHVAVLAERLLQLVRHQLLAHDWDGLRIVHFRLLSCVPPAGATITALSEPLAMTKQAVGQFVSQLQESGHLRLQPDETDRRRRVVVRTERGDRTVAAVDAAVADVERQWAARVGAGRYAEFSAVLRELTLP
jgi:DNA-binding MarR family transcriptional regulator